MQLKWTYYSCITATHWVNFEVSELFCCYKGEKKENTKRGQCRSLTDNFKLSKFIDTPSLLGLDWILFICFCDDVPLVPPV